MGLITNNKTLEEPIEVTMDEPVEDTFIDEESTDNTEDSGKYKKPKRGIVIANSVIRETPSPTARILRMVRGGRKITVYGESGNYYSVGDGYILKELVNL